MRHQTLVIRFILQGETLHSQRASFYTNMIDNMFSLGDENSESILKMGISLLGSKAGFAITVFLITVLLLSPLSTYAFRQSPIKTAITRKSSIPLSKEPNPSLSIMRNESIRSVKKKLDSLSVKFEDRKEIVKRFLDEFSQPFLDGIMNTTESNLLGEEEEQHTVVVKNPNVPKEGIAHFVFLVHGYNGKPADLLYLRTAMAGEAERRLASNAQNRDATLSSGSHTKEIVFHSCQSNWGRTSDGIEKGGERILDEIRSIIDSHIQIDEGDEHTSITISLIGNSLGGLYSRYAIAKMAEESDVVDEEFFLLGGKIKAHFNIFCTTGE